LEPTVIGKRKTTKYKKNRYCFVCIQMKYVRVLIDNYFIPNNWLLAKKMLVKT